MMKRHFLDGPLLRTGRVPMVTRPRLVTQVALVATMALGLLVTPRPVTAVAAGAVVQDPAKLLPRPYALEYSKRVDLDGDGDLDLAMVGINGPVPAPTDVTETFVEGDRILVIARKDSDGWRIAGRSTTAVTCRSCGGAFWGVVGAPVELSASRNTLVVAQSAGSREVTDWTHRYRLEKGGVRLIGVDRSVVDRATGGSMKESTNYLTGTRIVTVDGDVENPPKAGTTRGKPRVIYVERVTVE